LIGSVRGAAFVITVSEGFWRSWNSVDPGALHRMHMW